MSSRQSRIDRETKETQIRLSLDIDGSGMRDIRTPLPFLSHMLDAFARHGLFDLTVEATGDIEIDGHHTVEDIGLCLGMAFKESLGARAGITRYGWATIPMDETLVTCAIDFCGRPAFVWNVSGLERRWVGNFDCELIKEFFSAFTSRAECNLHVVLHYGENAHHMIEAIFKAFARACDAGSQLDPRLGGQVPSTKGTLSV